MNIAHSIEEARSELEAGHDKRAARLLTDAVYRTRDQKVATEIRELAKQGRSNAGFFGKGRWEEIIRLTDVRTANGNGNGNAHGAA